MNKKEHNQTISRIITDLKFLDNELLNVKSYHELKKIALDLVPIGELFKKIGKDYEKVKKYDKVSK